MLIAAETPEPETTLESPKKLNKETQPSKSTQFQKNKSEKLELSRKFSDNDTEQIAKLGKLVLKPIKTYVSSKQIDIISLFSNNVVSERVRKNFREEDEEEEEGDDEHSNKIIFETVQELDSDENSELRKAIDEETSGDYDIEKYHSRSDCVGSGTINQSPRTKRKVEIDNLISITDESESSAKKKKLRKSHTLSNDVEEKKVPNRQRAQAEVVYQEIDDDMMFELFDEHDEEVHKYFNLFRNSLMKRTCLIMLIW